MRNISTRQKGKKTLTSQYQSFEQRLESLEDKKAAHMQTWCQKDLETLLQNATGWQTHMM